MNLPNLLTLFRIILTPVLVICLLDGYFGWSLLIFLAAGITDGLDGFIARMTNQRTLLGAYLDPVADKFLINACFVTLAVLEIIPFWITVVVISRDVILLFGTLILHLMEHTDFNMMPSWMGKATTVIQLGYLVMVLAWVVWDKDLVDLEVLMALTAMATVLSGFHYVLRAVKRVSDDAHP